MIKKLFITAGVILLLILLILLYNSNFSDSAKKGNKNLDNIQNVKIGMDTLEVLSIMGKPENRWVFKSEIFFDYQLPPGKSGQLTLSIDSNGKVIHKGVIPK
ncbi:MAG: hypothetical protein K9I94_02535 [Bacteroidales bacterium]|nr:hypothetical protein [Bacteroidales bacterium]